jgi:hypothetical protein
MIPNAASEFLHGDGRESGNDITGIEIEDILDAR